MSKSDAKYTITNKATLNVYCILVHKVRLVWPLARDKASSLTAWQQLLMACWRKSKKKPWNILLFYLNHILIACYPTRWPLQSDTYILQETNKHETYKHRRDQVCQIVTAFPSLSCSMWALLVKLERPDERWTSCLNSLYFPSPSPSLFAMVMSYIHATLSTTDCLDCWPGCAYLPVRDKFKVLLRTYRRPAAGL